MTDKKSPCSKRKGLDNLSGKQAVILPTLMKFYKESSNIKKFLEIINGDVPISLRLIDWFVTNYSKKNNTMFDKTLYIKSKKSKDKKEDDLFNNYIRVNHNYKAQLTAYSKKNFDPFQRRERLGFMYGNKPDECISTTIGQLNFFKWSIENHILDYIQDNIQDIEEDMNKNISINSKSKSKKVKGSSGTTTSTGEQKKTLKQRKKRHELSKSGNKSIVRHNMRVSVNF